MKEPAYRRKPEDKRKTEPYQMRLTKAEQLELKRRAKTAGVTVAAYLLQKGLQK